MASGVLRWRRIPGPPPDPIKARLLRAYVALVRRFGPQRRRSRRSAYEIALAAVLTQRGAAASAARAMTALRARGLLRPDRLAAIGEAELAAVIRPAGIDRASGRRLQSLTRWLLARFGGRFAALRREPLPTLRRQMLAIPGLGPETVDAILLHAAGRPVFVADAAVRRVLARHGPLPPDVGYAAARRELEAHLPSDPALLGEFHALLVAVAAIHCRREACRGSCPLRSGLTRSPAGARRSARRRRGRRARGPARPSP